MYTDARTHIKGPPRSVKLHRVTAVGGGSLAAAPWSDPSTPSSGPSSSTSSGTNTNTNQSSVSNAAGGRRLVVAGRESLRILRITEPTTEDDSGGSGTSNHSKRNSGSSINSQSHSHKSATSQYGYRMDASRNLWEGSGLKVDSALTDVKWGTGLFSNKILTSARNGELIMWDIGKSGGTKFERKTKDHMRAIHSIAISSIVPYYCVTGSADGDVRIWDLRDLQKSLFNLKQLAPVRSVVFSSSLTAPLHIAVGCDNGNILRWDLQTGQRRYLDRVPLAHSGPILALDWSHAVSSIRSRSFDKDDCSGSGMSGHHSGGGGDGQKDAGWIVSGGLDRTVKVWNASLSHIPHRPTYTLHPSFPVRRVQWRPGYDCELAIVSNATFGTGSGNANSSDSQTQVQGMESHASTNNILKSLNQTFGPRLTITRSGGAAAILSGQVKTKTNVSNTTTTVTANMGSNSAAGSVSSSLSDGGLTRAGTDFVEVWDVRRGWIAKWAVAGSSTEGGVTDFTFADSHTIWAQHSSGTFSQLDLRNSYKPLDAIPRTSLAWEPRGALVFANGKRNRWETPYDDVEPATRGSFQERKAVPRVKRLGDPPEIPKSQTLGNFALDTLDLEVFVKLAGGYILEGGRKEICATNAQVAYESGKLEVAQAWLLLGSLVTDIIPPPTPPATPPLPHLIPLPHSTSAPAASSNVFTFPTQVVSAARASSSEPNVKPSGSLTRGSSGSPGGPSPRRGTPASSNQTSPYHGSIPLPSPTTPSSLRPSTDRRGSNSGLALITSRRMSSYGHAHGRPSLSSLQSESPSDSNRSHSSHRHVGEGALDDSDSSESDEGDAHSVLLSEGLSDGNEDEHSGLQPLLFSMHHLATIGRVAPPTPSPLSHVAGQQRWTEDEADDKDEDEASPSPASTDTDDGNSDLEDTRMSPTLKRKNIQPGRQRRMSLSHTKNRSRSSTVASLAASSLLQIRKPLVKQDSHSSIRTIIAGDTSMGEPDFTAHYSQPPLDLNIGKTRHANTFPIEAQKHHKQQGHSIDATQLDKRTDLNPDHYRQERIATPDHREMAREPMPHKRRARIHAEEGKFRDVGWDLLQEALEMFGDEGDVQTCAMMVAVAPIELGITGQQEVRYTEAYIELLARLRLHTAAAYLRKYSNLEHIRCETRTGTDILLSCAKCRKPIILPSSGSKLECMKGGYSVCHSCQNIIKCSICHMPVRTLIFQCSVCTHGGHQDCYRRYYMERPMVALSARPVLLPPPILPSKQAPIPSEPRGRSFVRSRDNVFTSPGEPDDDGTSSVSGTGTGTAGDETGSNGDPVVERSGSASGRNMSGHPCAAGCGHYCWAAVGTEGFN